MTIPRPVAVEGRELLISKVSKSELESHCARSSQFDSAAEARAAVARLFRKRTASDSNVSAALAELAALRHYPGAETNLGLAGCDFRIGRRRFEVKSIHGRNNKFLLNRASHDTQWEYSKPPHYYVFVRIRELVFDDLATLRVAYRAKVCSSAELLEVLRQIRKRRGSVPMFKHYVKLLPSDIGFPPEARGRRVSVLR